MTDRPFVAASRAQTYIRDFERLRRAIRKHDSFAAEEALDRCERWIDLIDPSKVPSCSCRNPLFLLLLFSISNASTKGTRNEGEAERPGLG